MFEPTTIFNAASWTKGGGDIPDRIPSWIAPREVASSSSPVSEWDHSGSDQPSKVPSIGPSGHASVLPTGEEPSAPAPEVLASAAVAKYEAEITRLRNQLQANIEAVSRVRRKVVTDSERDLVRLAVVIAEKIVGRELRVDPDLIANWAREGLDHLVNEGQIEVAVAADIAEAVADSSWTDADGNVLTPVVDSNLPPGGCELRGEFSLVDASARARLDAVSEAIGVTEE